MLDRNGLQSNTLHCTIDLGTYVQTLFFCISPCLVHGCAYVVAEPAGMFRDYSAAKLAALAAKLLLWS